MDDESYHYRVMARAIETVDRLGPQASLSDIAAAMDMSPAHFQRLFSEWAGVSPKRFAQYLALGHAKALLRENFTTLETADAVGLSGSGRLHDLFLRWEAMAPGEFARGGAGLTIRWGWFPSPFGPALCMGTAKGLCGIAFAADCTEDEAMADLTARWPAARYVHAPEAIAPWVDAAFAARGKAPLHLIGAPFQIKVWEALMRVPAGQVTTYSEIAQSIGHPRAVRAVGTAVGRNPISLLIPCHRALRKSGGLGGYHWGLPVKRAILAWEAAKRDASAEARP